VSFVSEAPFGWNAVSGRALARIVTVAVSLLAAGCGGRSHIGTNATGAGSGTAGTGGTGTAGAENGTGGGGAIGAAGGGGIVGSEGTIWRRWP